MIDPEKPNVAQPSPATPPNLESSKPAPNYSGTSYQQTSSVSSTTGTTRLPFFQNPGFYGALLILIGYFLPWFNTANSTGIELMQLYTGMPVSSASIVVMVVVIVPAIGALIVLINSFTGALTGVTGLFKWLTFLSVALFVTFLLLGMSNTVETTDAGAPGEVKTDDIASIMAYIGIGLWLAIAGAFVILFNRRVKLRSI